jgi:hypothetical protein
MRGPAYSDLVRLSEDERIDLMGRVAERGKSCGFFVEKDGSKGDRYIEKLTKRYRVRVIARKDAPIAGVEFISIGPTAGFN